ncbi:hypothetical protein Lfu02_14840 [Longispora fulva]|uniref:Uncharacterized protein n=1 Tax=Longispora fulva TaxID=619741 RepID=A0A8J7GYF5_9ACTN|nr:hypothetical protein [Longispora fulva]MBG6140506.1 hypothetical protein [Longispora fulva]GIG57112.1 hypothetical protein Lfu02_14840 [Longispora fulva]
MIRDTVLQYLALEPNPLNPPPAPPPGLEKPAELFLSWMKWGALLAGGVGFTISAVMMIAGRRNRSAMAADGASGIPWIIGGLSLASAGAGLAALILQ